MTTTHTLTSNQLLLAHIAALRQVVLRYRFSRGHTKCGPTNGEVSVDARCVCCREADDVMAQPRKGW